MRLPTSCALHIAEGVEFTPADVERIVETWRQLFLEHRGAGLILPVVGALLPPFDSAAENAEARAGGDRVPLATARACKYVARVERLGSGFVLAPQGVHLMRPESGEWLVLPTSEPAIVYADFRLGARRRP